MKESEFRKQAKELLETEEFQFRVDTCNELVLDFVDKMLTNKVSSSEFIYIFEMVQGIMDKLYIELEKQK